jgi:hypothetical protein
VRRPGEGKATWLYPNARGFKLAEIIPSPATAAKQDEGDASETPFWTRLDQPVQKIA